MLWGQRRCLASTLRVVDAASELFWGSPGLLPASPASRRLPCCLQALPLASLQPTLMPWHGGAVHQAAGQPQGPQHTTAAGTTGACGELRRAWGLSMLATHFSLKLKLPSACNLVVCKSENDQSCTPPLDGTTRPPCLTGDAALSTRLSPSTREPLLKDKGVSEEGPENGRKARPGSSSLFQ